MNHRRRRRVRLAAVALVAVSAGPARAVDEPARRTEPAPLAAATSGLFANALFEQNIGQHPEAVAYRASIAGGTASFTATGVDLAVPPGDNDAATPSVVRGDAAPSAGGAVTRLRVAFVQPATPRIVGVNQTPTRVNYLLGNDPSRWRTGVPTFRGVRYLGLWRGVDLDYGAGAGPLKGTYTVAPHTSPEVIRWRYPAATVRLAGRELVITPPGGGTVVERAPVAWQNSATGRQPVAVRYRLAADGTIGFILGRYDRARPLVIDPDIVWSRVLSYVTGASALGDVELDPAGDIVAVGNAGSRVDGRDDLHGSPSRRPYGGGGSDGLVVKVAPDGVIRWISYIGGSGSDQLRGLNVDSQGRIAFTGLTNSKDFPLVRPAEQRTYADDIVVGVLRADGAGLDFSTYVDGPAGENAESVRFGPGGTVTVVGRASTRWTDGEPYTMRPVGRAYRSPVSGAMVARYAASGALLWRAILGPTRRADGSGSGADARDEFRLWGVDVAPDGSVTVAGHTRSAYAPTTRDAAQRRPGDASGATSDGYVATLSPDGRRILYGSYYGGAGQDFFVAVGRSPAGGLWLLGQTESAAFPQLRAPARRCLTGEVVNAEPRQAVGLARDSDITVVGLDPTGRAHFAGCLGGSGADGANIAAGMADPVGDLTVDRQGNVFVTGDTCSRDFSSKGAWQPYRGSVYPGYCDQFAASLTSSGELRWASPLGGTDAEDGDGGIAVARDGRVVIVGLTRSADYPTTKVPPDVQLVYGSASLTVVTAQ